MAGPEVPRTPDEVAELEARYRGFQPASAWEQVEVDAVRWARHARALRAAVADAGTTEWEDVRERFLRAAALDSAALAELIRPAPDVKAVVLRGSVDESAWAEVAAASRLVVECHRRALVVASDAAARRQAIDENLIARLQDLIVEAQETYTVTLEGGETRDVELPRRQYKPVSNYLRRPDLELVPFAPAARVAEEMRRLTAELASDAFARLHPVVQAAYLHVALMTVHPFADGNGRLARTLASVPSLREVGLPQLIHADQWPAYERALSRTNDDDPSGIVELFLSAQVNAMGLARSLLESAGDAAPARAPTAPDAARTLLDLAAFHVREAIGSPDADARVAVTRSPDAEAVRVAVAGPGFGPPVDLEIDVRTDGDSGWLRLVTSAGDELEVWRGDVDPAPVEIVHLRVRAWVDGVLRGPSGLPESTPVRGLFVLGAPRSGTTMMGSWLGSHPDVLGLAEYGGFYVAHSVAPAYLARLPGAGHDRLLGGLRALAAAEVSRAARGEGRTWFCDATPWNLEVAGAIAEDLPDAVFVLMLRHFSGSVLSLSQLPWAGRTFAEVARLWARLNELISQLPPERTVVVDYDTLAAHPAEVMAGVGEAMGSLGLTPRLFDDSVLAVSHAHVVGRPRSTIVSTVEGELAFCAIPSLDAERWTPEIHREVWPEVAGAHQALRERFGAIYSAPPRPGHVAEGEW